MQLETYIDYTILKPETLTEQVVTLCKEAAEWKVKAVCVNPWFLETCRGQLQGSDVALCTVIGFPLGANLSETKIAEAVSALEMGADELDMVINVAALKEGKDELVFFEVAKIAELTKEKGKVLKVIIETALLTDQEKERVCTLLLKTGADYVKTSTGFAGGGATLEDIRLIKKIVGDSMKIKASGGIKTREFALALIGAGADRIGASSAKDMLFPEES